MCGIVGYISDRDVVPLLLKSLKLLEYRGYDSSGIAVVNGTLKVDKCIGSIESDLHGNLGIGHTRWATHGKVTKENAHPFVDCSGTIAIVHNGIIENYQHLKDDYPNHTYTSETDSETIVHLIEETPCLDFEDEVRCAVSNLQGNFAILAVKEGENRIVAARRGNPLYVSDGCASSDNILGGRLLDDNEVVSIYPAAVKDTAIAVNHTMLEEILEQGDKKWELREAALEVLRARDITFIGCGSSRYAAIVGRFFFSRIAGVSCDVVLASELQNFAESINRHSLVIAISQSGETADVIDGVRLAREHKAKVISIINRPDSLLSRLSDIVIPMNCGPELAVAATKSFTSTLCILYHLAHEMVGKTCNVEPFMSDCKEVLQGDDVYLIAKGINYPIALEGALKLKEITYIHAEALPAGELKHGSLALIEDGTPIIAVCPRDENFDACINNLMEAKTRGGYIIGISDVNHPVFDRWIRIPNSSPMACVVPLQMMSYYTSKARGLNPERPRSLAKSVTVK